MTRYLITNTAKGGRMIITPEGGATVFPGESRVFDLEENELKYAQPYFDNGDLTYREADASDDSPAVMTSLNPTPSSDGAVMVEANTLPNDSAPVADGGAEADLVDNETISTGDVTHVKHLGFGRWFGMKGEDKVTEAMSRAEAESFAQEHNVPIGSEADPSETAAPVETPPAEETPPPDET